MAKVVEWKCQRCGAVYEISKRVIRLASECYCRECRKAMALRIQPGRAGQKSTSDTK